MDIIAPNLFLGDSADAQDVLKLKDLNIRAILNCAFDLNVNYPSNHFISIKVGMSDGPGNIPLLYYLAQDYLRILLSQNEKVLVHCHEGRSRGASIVAYYLAIHGRISLEEAISEIAKKRQINIHPAHVEAINKLLKEHPKEEGD